MLKKLLTRALVALLAITLGYFAYLSTKRTMVPIERRAVDDEPAAERIKGRDVRYKSYDAEGNEIISGSSNKVTQTGDEQFELAEGLALKFNQDGKRYEVRADRFEDAGDGRQVLSAEPGGEIFLGVEDVTIRTSGPLIYNDTTGVFATEAQAEFSMGEARGSALGLRYKPDEFLELQRETLFFTDGPRENVAINADFIRIDQLERQCVIRDGSLVSFRGEAQTRLTAEDILLSYEGGRKGEPFLMRRAMISGAPASFAWDDGGLDASSFEACFDPEGRWVEEVLTEEDAVFTAQTADGYLIYGQGGQLLLTAAAAKPQVLASQSAIRIESRKAVGPSASLSGSGGFETRFRDGQAYSTRLFGAPHFTYGLQRGQAGSIRVMHGERNILFSQGAELEDRAERVRVLGDEIILDGWDQPEKAIYAADFVQIEYGAEAGQAIHCAGDSLKLRLPSREAKLEGQPARAWREGQEIEAGTIEINRAETEEEGYDLRAVGDVALAMDSENGRALVRAKSMNYDAAKRILDFDTVIRAVLPGQGELSCGALQAGLKEKNRERALSFVKAAEQVIFNGMIMTEGELKPISCQADRMDYQAEEAVIHFRGVGKDVVFKHPSGELTGRELTYFLNDGSIRVDSVTHGTTQTIINLKDNR